MHYKDSNSPIHSITVVVSIGVFLLTLDAGVREAIGFALIVGAVSESLARVD